MFRVLVIIAFFGGAFAAAAETLVAARTIRAQSILSPEDVKVIDRTIPGMLAHPDDVIGMETRVSLFSGRPIRPQDIGPPAIVERNQIVMLLYRRSGLSISAEGRALARAGVGDHIRVMNLASRSTIMGTVQQDGTIIVGGPALPTSN